MRDRRKCNWMWRELTKDRYGRFWRFGKLLKERKKIAEKNATGCGFGSCLSDSAPHSRRGSARRVLMALSSFSHITPQLAPHTVIAPAHHVRHSQSQALLPAPGKPGEGKDWVGMSCFRALIPSSLISSPHPDVGSHGFLSPSSSFNVSLFLIPNH